MILQSYQVDSFTNKVFCGNPACVVLLDEQLSYEILLKIAKENAVPETAFILPSGDDYILRWFTPDIEMDLCGHATLASAHILFTECNYASEEIHFKTASGSLTVKREGSKYFMDFPIREAQVASLPEEIADSLNIKPKEVYKARDYMLVYPSQKEIQHLEINRSIFDEININPGGVIAPYWSRRLKKDTLEAKQLSARGGDITCTVNEERVIISGNAVTFSKSDLYI